MACSKFSVGLISGVVLGVLFAPSDGCTTRKKIKDTSLALKDKFKHLMGKGEDELDELQHLLENETEALTTEARARLLKLVATSKKIMSNDED
jgi:gas vesicle protein